MSTPTPTAPAPSPALVAASPYLKQAIAALQTFVTTVLTGDPALLPARVAPAAAIFVNQVILLEPGLLVAEEGVAATSINGQLAALSAKLP